MVNIMDLLCHSFLAAAAAALLLANGAQVRNCQCTTDNHKVPKIYNRPIFCTQEDNYLLKLILTQWHYRPKILLNTNCTCESILWAPRT